jgi:membrane protein
MNSLLQKGRHLAAWLRPMQIPLHSARTGFFLILSLFPSLLLLLGLLRYTSFGTEDLLDLLEGMLPHSFLGIAEALIDASYRHSFGMVISVSALAALWSASKGTYGLLEGLNAVYGVTEHRGYWRSRSISVIYTFFFLLALVLTLVLHVFGNTVLDFLQMTTIPLLLLVMRLIDLKFILLLLLQTALFTLMYAMLPGRRNRLRRSLPGALLASFCWSVFSELFSIYVDYFSRYTNIFGSIYALALGMLWLYFCISILFYGGAFNRWLAQRKKNFS